MGSFMEIVVIILTSRLITVGWWNKERGRIEVCRMGRVDKDSCGSGPHFVYSFGCNSVTVLIITDDVVYTIIGGKGKDSMG